MRSAFALALLARPGGGHGRRGGEWAPARPSAGSLLGRLRVGSAWRGPCAALRKAAGGEGASGASTGRHAPPALFFLAVPAGSVCGVGEAAVALYCMPRRVARGARVAARGTGGARGAAVGQPRGACAPRKLLDRRLHCERGRRYSNFPLPIKSARPLLFSRRNLACCFFFFIGVCNFQAAYSCIIVE